MSADFDVRQETDRVSGRPIVTTGIVALVTGTIGLVAASVVLQGEVAGRDRGPNVARVGPPQIGMVEHTLVGEVNRGPALWHEQREALTRYEWVDRDAGVVRIPIERAMDIVAGPDAGERSP